MILITFLSSCGTSCFMLFFNYYICVRCTNYSNSSLCKSIINLRSNLPNSILWFHWLGIHPLTITLFCFFHKYAFLGGISDHVRNGLVDCICICSCLIWLTLCLGFWFQVQKARKARNEHQTAAGKERVCDQSNWRIGECGYIYTHTSWVLRQHGTLESLLLLFYNGEG